MVGTGQDSVRMAHHTYPWTLLFLNAKITGMLLETGIKTTIPSSTRAYAGYRYVLNQKIMSRDDDLSNVHSCVMVVVVVKMPPLPLR